MALNVRPILSSISAFDADFGLSEKGKEDLKAPIFKFSWKNSAVARKNTLRIRDYDTNVLVYECTITTMAQQHQLHRTIDNVNEKIEQNVEYRLENGRRYKATITVTVADDLTSEESEPVIFYCFSTPTFNFINFSTLIGESGNEVALVNSSSINLLVNYNQIEDEKLSSYKFELYENQQMLYESSMKYNSSSDTNVTIGYTIGGIKETEQDNVGNIKPGKSYEIICIGQTKHGLIIEARQRFVIKLPNTGVGSLIKAENVGDGTVMIKSNYIIMNAKCSNENPTYLKDKDGNPYAIDLTKGDYVEYFEGFVIQKPYEFIIDGSFLPGQLITLRGIGQQNSETGEISYKYGFVHLKKIEYTNFPYYYFSFSIAENDIVYEIRTEYFRYETELVNATLDISYNDNGFYNILAKVNYGDDTYVVLNDEKGNISLTFIEQPEIIYDGSNVTIGLENISVIDDKKGNIILT